MSYIDGVFFVLHVTSMVGTAFIFYQKGGSIINRIINHPTIQPYKNKVIDFKSDDIINEERFCSSTSALTGLFVGRFAWPICLPYSMWYMQREYMPTVRKFLKDL